ncbi:hypothetical protein PGTUg99_019497 [Puccinia graminis f. sp. tritici]|uniref:Uncharacterized protein n=1 Tax=Puccinia graminis f. sp. tritici TaxID=56615 RepID=A0A5B0RY82_PUCGR|nr:hypothetical protein PGTUg99_019497 [Puccinia graminis f. sp. tritici]
MAPSNCYDVDSNAESPERFGGIIGSNQRARWSVGRNEVENQDGSDGDWLKRGPWVWCKNLSKAFSHLPNDHILYTAYILHSPSPIQSSRLTIAEDINVCKAITETSADFDFKSPTIGPSSATLSIAHLLITTNLSILSCISFRYLTSSKF